MKYNGPLTEKELRDEMENWTLFVNAFLYKEIFYYFEHDPGDLRYYVGIYDTTNDDERWDFPDFEAVMNSTFLDNKPFRELLPKLDWET